MVSCPALVASGKTLLAPYKPLAAQLESSSQAWATIHLSLLRPRIPLRLSIQEAALEALALSSSFGTIIQGTVNIPARKAANPILGLVHSGNMQAGIKK